MGQVTASPPTSLKLTTQAKGEPAAKKAHGYHADVFEGQEGIYVAGGFDGIGDLSSTEFYNAEMDR